MGKRGRRATREDDAMTPIEDDGFEAAAWLPGVIWLTTPIAPEAATPPFAIDVEGERMYVYGVGEGGRRLDVLREVRR